MVPLLKPIRLLCTLTQSLAHGEAGSDAFGPDNLTLFHREPVLLPASPGDVSAPAQGEHQMLERLYRLCPVGVSAIEFLQSLSCAQVIGVLFIAQIIRIYGSGEGTGLFSGVSRYQYLATRLRDGVAACLTLAELWSYLGLKLLLPHPPESAYERLACFFMIGPATQAAIFVAFRKQPDVLIMGSRFVIESLKMRRDADTGTDTPGVATNELQQLTTTPGQMSDMVSGGSEVRATRIPAISGNALRHCVLREPGATRLLQDLGCTPAERRVPVGVERFLYGGGNTFSRAHRPGNSDILEATVRQAYPFIDALGGAFDQFLMSQSAVAVAGWLVCRENNRATEAVAGITASHSIYDLIFETTRTRVGIGGSDKKSGQMQFVYEVLPIGTQLLIEIRFLPFAPALTYGAMQQAVTDWIADGGRLGARTAQGHGRALVEWQAEQAQESQEAYLSYLRESRAALADGLCDGTFTTGTVLCAQT